MSGVGDDDRRCLNCGTTLHGPYCASCGQRAVPPYPNVLELAGDAWQELTGYDGRIAMTCRGLLRPGQLTRHYLEGRRARYLSPVRLYLIVSVVYFIVAAAMPEVIPTAGGRVFVSPGIRIGLDSGSAALSPEQRTRMLAEAEQSPWMVRPVIRALADDPVAFRARIFAVMPRVFFAMLPVFAALVSLFYRGRRFPTHLVFAVHVHAFAFVVLTVAELTKLTGSPLVMGVMSAAVALTLGGYVLAALRQVYGGAWLATMAKAAGIGVLYVILSLPAFLIVLTWAALS